MSADREKIRDATGAILAGRRWHDVAMERYSGRAGIYGGEWNGPVFVLTHELPSNPPDPAIRFVSGTIEDAAAAACGLYGDDGAATIRLERIEATVSPQLTDLRFRVAQ
jgi:hypothetical protein